MSFRVCFPLERHFRFLVADPMCRLLLVKSSVPVSMRDYLEQFAWTAKNSPEDQSHGWGCAWLGTGGWQIYRNIKPVWEDCFKRFGPSNYFLAHARSAYRNEGIEVGNNMPFGDREQVFIFNGELQGVRIRENGRIGAEKVFNFIKRFDAGDLNAAIAQGVDHLVRKTRYVRAMNLIIATHENAWLCSKFNENSDYFQMYQKQTADSTIISSAPFADGTGWQRIDNHTIRRIDAPGL